MHYLSQTPKFNQELLLVIMRYSPQRESILKVLQGTNTHPIAEWIFEQVREEIPKISLGTVYRNLNQLADHGLIKRIFDNGQVRYDGTTERHDHFRCELCGRIYDFDIPWEGIVPQLVPANGFLVSDYSLEISGICRECSQPKGTADHVIADRR